jgi:hypothetical protein
MTQRRPSTKRAFTERMVGMPPDDAPVVQPPEQPPGAPQPSELLLHCEYRRVVDDAPFVCLYCRHIAADDDMTASGIPASRTCPNQMIEQQNKAAARRVFDKKIKEKERRAKAEKDRRQKKRDQLAAIKAALRVPAAERLAEAKRQEAEKKEQERDARRSLGSNQKYITGGGLIDDILLKKDEEEFGFGGRRVSPEGTGHRPGARSDEDDGSPDPDSSPLNPWAQGSEEWAVAHPNTPILQGTTFPVKLNQEDETKSPAFLSVPHFFYEIDTFRFKIFCTKCGVSQDDGTESLPEDHYDCWQCGAPHDGYEPSYVCRLCGDASTGKAGAARHMLNVHGNENSPAHDSRFGDVLRRWNRGGRKPPNVGKARRKAGQGTA